MFRPSTGTWYTGLTAPPINWGASGDRPTPADFDGDGKTDVAVYRGGTWYILNQTSGAFSVVSWGNNTDRPAPAAYIP
jgi:hypothetical protein